jgi:transcriptional regulator with XRE-family HTH domain
MKAGIDTLGGRVRIARERAGLSQRVLAERVGVAHQQISDYERNQAEPRYEVLRQIGFTLGCSPAWLAFGIGPEHTTDRSGSSSADLASECLVLSRNANGLIVANAGLLDKTDFSESQIESLRVCCVAVQKHLQHQQTLLTFLHHDLSLALQALHGRSPGTGVRISDT